MKKILLTVTMCFLSVSSAYAAPSFDPRTYALAGTGMAGGNYNNITLNPALATIYDKGDDFFFGFSGGVQLTDKSEVIQGATDLIKAMDKSPKAAFNILNDLSDAKSPLLAEGGVNFVLAVPTEKIGVGITFNTGVIILAGLNVDARDLALTGPGGSSVIEDLVQDVIDGSATVEDIMNTIHSSASMVGVGTSELGVSVGMEFFGIKVGLKPKMQVVFGLGFNTNLSSMDLNLNFDSSDLNYRFNMDMGFHKTFFENLAVGLTVTNLIPYEYTLTGNTGKTLKINPQMTVGAAYKHSLFIAELNLDLLEGWEIGDHKRGQFLRTGFEFGGQDKFYALRVGYALDMRRLESDMVTAGLGFKILRSFSIDLAGSYGLADNGLGATFGIGLEF